MSQLGFEIASSDITGDAEIVMVKLSDLPPNDELLRRVNKLTLENIKQYGQKVPILLRSTPDGFEVIDGRQRIKIARRLDKEEIPAIIKDIGVWDAKLESSYLNNARQQNDINDVMRIREILDEFPSSTAKGIEAATAIPQGRVKSLMKQARMPMVFLKGVDEGTISQATLADLSKKPNSLIRKAEKKYRENREGFIDAPDPDTGERVFTRLSDGKVFASVPSLLTSGDIKDFQRISVENTVNSAPMDLGVRFETAIEGFAAVKDGKFITDLFPTSDEVRLELGRKKGTIVKVRSI